MKKVYWKHIFVLGLIGMVALTGCKKRGAGAGADGDNIGGIMGADMDGSALGMRPGDGAAYQEGLFPAVYFAYDSSRVEPSQRGVVEQVANTLRGNRQSGIVVEGHCDERGSREYNLALGERRALAVRAYLIELGVDGSRIQTKSMGEEQPAAMGHDEGAWSRNRRAEFLVF